MHTKRRFLFGVVAAIGLAVLFARPLGAAWITGGILTNPAIDTILADSGALAGGQTSVKIIFGGSVAAIATIEHRNAANTVNVNSQVIAIVANQAVEFELPGVTFAASERIRLRLNAAVTGSLQASIFTF